MARFKVKKAYRKGEKGWRVIIPHKDGMHTTIEKGLTLMSAKMLQQYLSSANAAWRRMFKKMETQTHKEKAE